MMTPKFVLFLLFSWVSLHPVDATEIDARSLREKAEAEVNRQNWKKASLLYRELLDEVKDFRSSVDLREYLVASKALGGQAHIDADLERWLELRQGEESFHIAVAEVYQKLPAWGRLVDGVFHRGHSRVQGEHLNVGQHDRIKAIRILLEGKGAKASMKWYKAMLVAFQQGGSFSHRWNHLTPLEKEPAFQQENLSAHSYHPVLPNGEIDWIRKPVRFKEAKNDAERFFWLVEEAVKVHGEEASLEVQKIWAEFLNSVYQQGNELSRNDDLPFDPAKVWLHLEGGAKPQYVTLPADLNTHARFEKWAENHDWAVNHLYVKYLAQSELPRAVKALEEAIPRFEERRKEFEDSLDQLTGDWMQLTSPQTFVAGREVELTFNYRNAKKAHFEMSKMKREHLKEVLLEMLKQKRNSDFKMADYFFNRRGKGFLEESQKWSEKLTPKQGHLPTNGTTVAPERENGLYLLKCQVRDSDPIWTLIQISDSVLVQWKRGGTDRYQLMGAHRGEKRVGKLTLMGVHYERLPAKNEKKPQFKTKTKTFELETNSEGFAEKENQKPDRNYEWQILAETQSGALLVSDLTNRYSYHKDFNDEIDEAWKTQFLSDRPVYQPKQEVNLKFWVQRPRLVGRERSEFAGETAYLSIKSPRGDLLVEDVPLRADSYGGVQYQWKIPKGVSLGRYNVSLGRSKKKHNWLGQGFFQVEEYEKPEYEVKVETPSKPLILGEEIPVVVKALYFHGAPVTQAKVKVKITRHAYHWTWRPVEEWDWLYGSWFEPRRYSFCRPYFPSSPVSGEVVLEEEVELDADGMVKVQVPTAETLRVYGKVNCRYQVEVEVVDQSRRMVAASGEVLVGGSAFQSVLYHEKGFLIPEKEAFLKLRAENLMKRGFATKGEATLYRIKGLRADKTVDEVKVKSFPVMTNSKGDGELSYQVSKAGQYRWEVTLKDDSGNESISETVISVMGRDPLSEGVFSPLELSVENPTHSVGDTVRVLIQTKIPNSRVLVVTRSTGSKERFFYRQLEGHSQVIEIPVRAEDQPNFFVKAMTVSETQMKLATAEVRIPPRQKLLSMEVIPSKQKYKAGEKGSIRVRLSDPEGKPYQGSITLSIYDKSLEAISPYQLVALKQTFWSMRRSLSYENWLVRQKYFPQELREGRPGMKHFYGGMRQRFNSDPFASAGFVSAPSSSMAKSLGNSDPFADASELTLADEAILEEGAEPRSAPVIRSNFADLVKWLGEAETDANGELEIPVEFPDNLTTWKIRAWAMGHGAYVGEAQAEVITSKDLLIRLQSPRFFVERDEAVLSAIVHNYHPEAKEVRVRMEVEGGSVVALENRTPLHTIPPGGEVRVDWRVRAEKEGEVKIRMLAEGKDDSDAIEKTFSVLVHGFPRLESWSRSLSSEQGSTKIMFQIPERRRASESLLECRFSPTIAGSLVEALPYLVSYPHGCTEQTLNRFIPTIIVRNLLGKMDLDLEQIREAKLDPQTKKRGQWSGDNPVWDVQEVDRFVAAGVKKLESMQNSDGGWGWFSGKEERSYSHTTAVVIHGLLKAQELGVEVPYLKKGITWLKHQELKELKRFLLPEEDSNHRRQVRAIDAKVRMVLGEAGVDQPEMLAKLHERRGDLPVYAKCLLGLEWHRSGEVEKRDLVLENIEQYLVQDSENQTAYLELPHGSYWWYWYGSEYEAQAWYLKLLAKMKPDSAQASGMAKYLLNNRKNATYWNSTRDSAYCIEALSDYAQASGELSPELEVEIRLDGEVIRKESLSKENLFTFNPVVKVSGDILTGGEHTLEIRKKGKSPLYFNAEVEVFTLEDHIPKAGLELKVERRYRRVIKEQKEVVSLDRNGQKIMKKVESVRKELIEDGAEVRSGDLIEVELIIDSKNDYEYLLLEDPKPAGFEALETRSGYYYNSIGSYVEWRKSKVNHYLRALQRGKHRLVYELRAQTPGSFGALPTKLEAMYAPELRGNSQSQRVKVAEAAESDE